MQSNGYRILAALERQLALHKRKLKEEKLRIYLDDSLCLDTGYIRSFSIEMVVFRQDDESGLTFIDPTYIRMIHLENGNGLDK